MVGGDVPRAINDLLRLIYFTFITYYPFLNCNVKKSPQSDLPFPQKQQLSSGNLFFAPNQLVATPFLHILNLL